MSDHALGIESETGYPGTRTISKSLWIYSGWCNWRPSIGSDEYGRDTIVVPFWPNGRAFDGRRQYRTLVIALPWCFHRVEYDAAREAIDALYAANAENDQLREENERLKERLAQIEVGE